MGAYPQGTRKYRIFKTMNLISWSFDKVYHRHRSPRPDRYKSYRARRKFKRLIIRELLDDQRSRYMRTTEEVLGEE